MLAGLQPFILLVGDQYEPVLQFLKTLLISRDKRLM
jgi:hypothetical protein